MTGRLAAPSARSNSRAAALCFQSSIGLCLLVACGGPEPEAAGRRALAGSFESVFSTEARITVEEASDDVIGDLRSVLETATGDLIIADALQARLRRYDRHGALESTFGAFGAGPFEFRRIGGVAEGRDGKVYVTDPSLGRITVLKADLTPDTLLIPRPPPRGSVRRLGGDLLLLTSGGARVTSVSLFEPGAPEPHWTIPAPDPGPMQEFPYWGSVARVPLATWAGGFVIAYSLRYPIYLHDPEGAVVDSLTHAPGTFRPTRVVEAGAFSGTGAADRMKRWLESFDVIANLSVLDDTLLVVTHGRLSSSPTSRFSPIHERLDIYDLNRRTKIVEGVALPDGSRVLGGGKGLYILIEQPPNPWTILRVRFDPEALPRAR